MKVATFTVQVTYDPQGPSPTMEVLATVAASAMTDATRDLTDSLAQVYRLHGPRSGVPPTPPSPSPPPPNERSPSIEEQLG